ncbi:MAG: hypothetical protein IIA82_08720 [Thaumarchaeota archaeon]|nr:hypothetical protein [Nitrososphaerota archaeon]
MNTKLRLIGFLAILPLLTVALSPDYIIDADALRSQGDATPGRLGINSYGSANSHIVCGDRLCSEIPAPTTISAETLPEPPTETEEERVISEDDLGSVLKLSRANVPAEIPLHQGYYNSESVYFIITDSSDSKYAEIITEQQGWKVELAPPLANTPEAALSTTYIFSNGVQGDGVLGFQGEVFTSTPAQPEVYSALTSNIQVTWNDGQRPTVLDSEEAILNAENQRKITLTELDVVINMPQIVWPEGQILVKEDKTLTDDTPYGGGQVLDIDLDEMTVTFIAHRGWGPDGRTIYYIVTDATPVGPANMMGVTSAPTSASLIASSAAVDLFQFKNGIKGSGPLGFQAGIAASAPGDANYSPMWRIFMISWNDPANASLLETVDDFNAFKKAGLIDINIARPMNADHIVNCPFIDPFQ